MGLLVAVHASLVARCEDGPEDTDMEVNFHTVAGAWLGRLMQMMESPSAAFAHKVLCILQEPGRLLNLLSMEASEGRLQKRRPLIFDCADLSCNGTHFCVSILNARV